MTTRRWLCVLCLGGAFAFVNHPLPAQSPEELRGRNTTIQRGMALFEQKKYKEAAQALERGLDLSSRLFGADDPRTLATHGVLGTTYFILGDHAKGETHYLRGLRGAEKTQGKTSPEVAHGLCYLGFRAREKGDAAAAEDYLTRGVKTWDVVPEAARARYDSGASFADALGVLGELFRARGEYAKAEGVLLRAKMLREAQPEKHNALLGLRELGQLYTDMKDYAKAETLLRRVVETQERQGDSTDLADSLRSLAVLSLKMGEPAKGETLLRRALKISENRRGNDHPETAHVLQSLGAACRQQEKYDEAQASYERALKILETKYGADSPQLFFVLESMAVLAHSRNQQDQALAIRLRTLKMAEAQYGPDHPHTALVLHHLGDNYRLLGDRAKAETHWSRALKARVSVLGADHPDTNQTLFSLSMEQGSSGQWERALATLDGVRRSHRRYIAHVLPGLSEAQQLSVLEASFDARPGFHVALALGRARASDPAAVTLSAEWLLNGKGIIQQALAERGQLALASTDPAQAKTLAELNQVRGRLAALNLALPRAGQEAAHRKDLDRLAVEEQELAKRLGRALGRPTRPDPWVSIAEVRQALPADAVLVEIARFRAAELKDFRVERQQAHYVAWVIPAAGKGEVKLVDLGPAERIDQAIAAVRKGLSESPKSIHANGPEEAEKELRKTLEPLAKLVLEPLLPQLGVKKQWILSPDAELWLVPWAALPLPDGSYAVEKHQIGYVVSGRDLATPAFQAPAERDPPLIMADPDYDLDPQEGVALAAKLLGKAAPSEASLVALLDRPSGLRSISVGRVGRLPGSAAEAVAIKPKVKTYAGAAPWVYSDKNGLEAVFKAFRGPKVMVLSTHGYFLEDDAKTVDNPLLRCGLLLAACNRRAQMSATPDDGVLTGLEIVGCDLRGTELVVLSACETGLGQVRTGEGVAGLRQAFQLAGAQAVVATLWNIPDRDTAFLMTDFFDHLAKGKGKAEALREAQLARIKAHRDRDGAAHPFLWAAFTLTGR